MKAIQLLTFIDNKQFNQLLYKQNNSNNRFNNNQYNDKKHSLFTNKHSKIIIKHTNNSLKNR